ncbi:trigger factor [Neolewinella lacunae]|uniref:Trigger factor ribosome-binding bacterial domain-containing protein n=1 Tax=Neolewinella lacunae TaxID=1517758 RepID=A0A923TA83_9BACT|nr:trigger factor [Neolewinella lacunae]MBC6996279.1 hypothetical protein [Neolewinella lacunae]MDN3636902.1 trigger factor [Neolewinella lacunae]
MPQVSFEKTGNVTARIAVTLTQQELETQLSAELNKRRGKVAMKGFRKGKTPVSTLRKMVGNQILAEIIDKEVRNALFGYIDEHQLRPIFSPQPIDDEESAAISAMSLRDLNLNYDVALEPEFELELPTETFQRYVFDANPTFVDEQIEKMLKQAGEAVKIEDGTVEENDILEVTIRETGPVEEPIVNSTKIYVDSLTEDSKAQLLGKKVGESIVLNDLGTLEKNSTPEAVNRYLLALAVIDTDVKDKSFEIKIDEISRLVPAQLNEDFFNSFDPSGEVQTEEQLRERIIEQHSEGFNEQGYHLLDFDLRKAIVERNNFELPLEMMEEMIKDDKDTSLDLFERSVRWSLIRTKIIEQNDLKIAYEDIKEEATGNLVRMLGGRRPDFLNDDFLESYVGNMLKDEKQREQLTLSVMDKKVMAILREKITVVETPLSAEAFNQAIDDFNTEHGAAEEE